MTNSKSKSREPRTISNNLGAALLAASKDQHKPIPGMGRRKPRKPENRRPKSRPQRGAFASKPVQPTPEARKLAATMAHRIAKASKVAD